MSDLPTTLRSGRFTVVRILGEGSQASTFEAIDRTSPRRVAVKRFRVRGAKSWKEVELAEREARVLASLSHPGIPRYVDHFEEGGELFLVTEMIEGTSLADLKKSGRSLGESDVIRFLRDASSVLDYLHGRAPPIIHRDIKPSNVILRPDGGFALIDFGAVRDRLKPEGGSTVVGTFGFMAPEQFQGRAVAGTDVYAVGATAIALLTGQQPEELPHRGLAIDVAAALRGVRVSPAMIAALTAMVEPDPDRRPGRLAPLLGDLEKASRGGKSSAKVSASPPRDRSRRDARRDERERRHEERQQERDRRRAAKREDRDRGRGRGSSGIPGLVLFMLSVGLVIAELAVAVVLRAAIPLAFTILSLIFGRRWRDAGASVGRAGAVAGAAIRDARRRLESRERDEPIGVRVVADVDAPGVRVAGAPRVEVDPAADEARWAEEEEARVEADAEARARARRGRS
jgi:tRNA A-37 threonylcarbamoyl transferase component Bud32